GTPLDDTEELLIRNRRRSIAIAARAIIRAGKGHKYWYDFAAQKRSEIEEKADKLHKLLFNPEYSTPIKTLDLPIGGVAGVRNALSLLIEYVMLAIRDHEGKPLRVEDLENDESGDKTIEALDRTLDLVQRMTGNDRGSLGLHPAIYFYGNTGRYAIPLFMGMSILIARKLRNNDTTFFKKFTSVRQKFEELLVERR